MYVILYDMNPTYVVTVKGDQILQIRRGGETGRADQVVVGVCTVRDVCRRLHKSRRQVYRYLREGRLSPCARVLGQWLFSAASVEQWTPSRHIPNRLRPYFWDTEFSTILPERHRDFILSRILEHGDLEAVRWALRTYPKPLIIDFLRGRGKAVLSQRAWHFWASHVRLARCGAPRPDWRSRGRLLGGRP